MATTAERAPVLVACAHGTREPAGRRAMAELRLAVSAMRPGIDVRAANVDVQEPSLARTLARIAADGRRAVVVPLLLSAGYHVHVDVAEAVAGTHGAVAASALGPDRALVDVLLDRLAESAVEPDTPVVLAAAGSSDARALADVEAVVAGLAARRSGPVVAGYLSAADPTVAEAVAGLRTGGRSRVAVATYLLAPGFFARRLAEVGADAVTAPLAPHPALASLVLRRYDEALATS